MWVKLKDGTLINTDHIKYIYINKLNEFEYACIKYNNHSLALTLEDYNKIKKFIGVK